MQLKTSEIKLSNEQFKKAMALRAITFRKMSTLLGNNTVDKKYLEEMSQGDLVQLLYSAVTHQKTALQISIWNSLPVEQKNELIAKVKQHTATLKKTTVQDIHQRKKNIFALDLGALGAGTSENIGLMATRPTRRGLHYPLSLNITSYNNYGIDYLRHGHIDVDVGIKIPTIKFPIPIYRNNMDTLLPVDIMESLRRNEMKNNGCNAIEYAIEHDIKILPTLIQYAKEEKYLKTIMEERGYVFFNKAMGHNMKAIPLLLQCAKDTNCLQNIMDSCSYMLIKHAITYKMHTLLSTLLKYAKDTNCLQNIMKVYGDSLIACAIEHNIDVMPILIKYAEEMHFLEDIMKTSGDQLILCAIKHNTDAMPTLVKCAKAANCLQDIMKPDDVRFVIAAELNIDAMPILIQCTKTMDANHFKDTMKLYSKHIIQCAIDAVPILIQCAKDVKYTISPSQLNTAYRTAISQCNFTVLNVLYKMPGIKININNLLGMPFNKVAYNLASFAIIHNKKTPLPKDVNNIIHLYTMTTKAEENNILTINKLSTPNKVRLSKNNLLS